MTARQENYHRLKEQRKPRINTTKINNLKLKAMQVKAKQGAALASTLQHLACKTGCIWDGELKKWMDLEALLQHPNPEVRERWQKSSTKEHGSLFQGFGETEGKNVCQWVQKQDVLRGEKVTCPRTAADYGPEKVDSPRRTRITAGGDKLDYDGETMVNSADYTVIKCHWNSMLSSPGCKHATMDAGNMCLESNLPKSRNVRFKPKQIPVAMQMQCNLAQLVYLSGYVYARINKAWYRLKEAGKIAGDDIRDHLGAFGHHESKFTKGFFTHETRPINFTLAVDGFGVKHKNLEDFEHLRGCLSLRCAKDESATEHD